MVDLADPASGQRAALRRGLAAQEARLRTLRHRVAEAAHRLRTTGTDLHWVGPASNAYSDRLRQVAGRLAVAELQLDAALRETRRAVETLEH